MEISIRVASCAFDVQSAWVIHLTCFCVRLCCNNHTYTHIHIHLHLSNTQLLNNSTKFVTSICIPICVCKIRLFVHYSIISDTLYIYKVCISYFLFYCILYVLKFLKSLILFFLFCTCLYTSFSLTFNNAEEELLMSSYSQHKYYVYKTVKKYQRYIYIQKLYKIQNNIFHAKK